MSYNPFNYQSQYRPMYNTKRRQEVIDKVNNNEELSKIDSLVLDNYNKRLQILDTCASEKEQYSNLIRNPGKGIMNFKWKGSEYYNAIKAIILGESGAGKSYLMTSLLFEIPNSFESITLFAPESTYQNECYQCIQELCESVGIKFFWIDTTKKDFDIHNYVAEPEINEDYSSNSLYDNTFGSLWIFDDIYNSHCRNSWIQKLYSEAFIRLRHRRINTFVLLQGASYLDSELVNNFSHIFMSSAFVNKGEEMFRKLHCEMPENFSETIEIIKSKDPSDAKHTFWFFKNGESLLKEYIPYEFKSKTQVKQKMMYKLPKPLRKIKNAEKKNIQKDSEKKNIEISKIKEQMLIDSFEEINPNVKESKPIEAKPNEPITKKELEIAVKKTIGVKKKKKIRVGNMYYYK